jgi:hypothetical protein
MFTVFVLNYFYFLMARKFPECLCCGEKLYFSHAQFLETCESLAAAALF